MSHMLAKYMSTIFSNLLLGLANLIQCKRNRLGQLNFLEFGINYEITASIEFLAPLMIITITNRIIYILFTHLAKHAFKDVNGLVKTIFRVRAISPLHISAIVCSKIRRNISGNKY